MFFDSEKANLEFAPAPLRVSWRPLDPPLE